MARKEVLKSSVAVPAEAVAPAAPVKATKRPSKAKPAATVPPVLPGRVQAKTGIDPASDAALPEGVRHGSLLLVNPMRVEVEPGYNVRDFNSAKDPDDLELKNSIRENGIITPLEVRIEGKHVFVTAGHRRLFAVRELILGDKKGEMAKRFATIPATREPEGTTTVQRTLHLITSNQGKPLNQIQRGTVFNRLAAAGWKNAEIAQRSGVTARYVSDLRELAVEAAARPEIGTAVNSGKISSTLAISVIRQTKGDASKVIAKAIETAEQQTGAKKGKVTEQTLAKIGAATKAKPAATAKPAPAAPVKPAITSKASKPDATIAGPFTCDDEGSIMDATGAGIAGADSGAIGRAMVALLNAGWDVLQAAKASAKAAPASAKAAPASAKAAPAKAAPASAKAAPAETAPAPAETALGAAMQAARARKPAGRVSRGH